MRNPHGLVHGRSTIDSAYHSRVLGKPCKARTFCAVGQFDFGSALKQGRASAGTTCNVLLTRYGPECAGWAQTIIQDRVVHYHRAHKPCHVDEDPPTPIRASAGGRP